MLAPISLALPQIRDGKLLALGVTTARRSTLLPEVPTIAEAGVAGFDFPIWYGVWAPAGDRPEWLTSLRRTSDACSPGRICATGLNQHGRADEHDAVRLRELCAERE